MYVSFAHAPPKLHLHTPQVSRLLRKNSVCTTCAHEIGWNKKSVGHQAYQFTVPMETPSATNFIFLVSFLQVCYIILHRASVGCDQVVKQTWKVRPSQERKARFPIFPIESTEVPFLTLCELRMLFDMEEWEFYVSFSG